MQTQLTHPQVHISQVIRNAIVFNFKNWQKESINVDALLQTVADLFALLSALARILGKASKQNACAVLCGILIRQVTDYPRCYKSKCGDMI